MPTRRDTIAETEMMHLLDLEGRHALVTGASSGLGRHHAETLARAGARVTVAARRADALAETVALIEAGGGQAHAVVMDVTDAGGVEVALDAAQERFGPVTVLINNAGVGGGMPALELDGSVWARVVDTNLTGLWSVAQACAKRMVAAGTGGSIVNIASIGGLRQTYGNMPYSVSKTAVVQLTKCLALEWARHGIRVNALAPGFFKTDANAALLESERGEEMVRRIPQRRTGRMSELDGPLLLLASDAGSFMTGSVVVVDGGHLVSSL